MATLVSYSSDFYYLSDEEKDASIDLPFDCIDDKIREEDPSFDCFEQVLSPAVKAPKTPSLKKTTAAKVPLVQDEEHDQPFDEVPFDVQSPQANVVSPSSVRSKKSVSFQIPAGKANRRSSNISKQDKQESGTPDTSYVTTSSSEEDLDYSFLSSDSTLDYPPSSEVDASDNKQQSKDEWCINLMFSSLGNEQSNWFTKEYRSNKQKVKGFVFDCFEPPIDHDDLGTNEAGKEESISIGSDACCEKQLEKEDILLEERVALDESRVDTFDRALKEETGQTMQQEKISSSHGKRRDIQTLKELNRTEVAVVNVKRDKGTLPSDEDIASYHPEVSSSGNGREVLKTRMAEELLRNEPMVEGVEHSQCGRTGNHNLFDLLQGPAGKDDKENIGSF
eukprot:scaffold22649_cov99-Cylindrotheca_fusiformis.AAC.4